MDVDCRINSMLLVILVYVDVLHAFDVSQLISVKVSGPLQPWKKDSKQGIDAVFPEFGRVMLSIMD